MTKKHSLKSLVLLFLLATFLNFCYSQNYPGGVPEPEVWYISVKSDLENETFQNFAHTDININMCNDAYYGLFNFNPSIETEQLCLNYRAPLENSTGRNVFFVGMPTNNERPLSHLGTLWWQELDGLIELDSINRNFLDFNNRNVFTKGIYSDYVSDKNARVNFYHTNFYNIDRKFKSYGQEGETIFYLGKPTIFDQSNQTYLDLDFGGKFPEFISYDRELSFNERSRVESYLALKYGLTLEKTQSYINSKNIVFWEYSNNDKFPNRIFGIGKDNISSLNQLQSQSTHLEQHLICAVGEIAETNKEKQEVLNIDNNSYLVFGDNGKRTRLINSNSKGLTFWEKTWLAQRTGREVHNYNMNFKLFLPSETVDHLESNPDDYLWMLKDIHVGNDEVSDFDNDAIEYYKGVVDLETGTAYFQDIFFDTDFNVYDQFTFGVGPEMIVQVQVTGCYKEVLEAEINISGGTAPYHIVIESTSLNIDTETQESTYTFNVDENINYHIVVTDQNGLESIIDITPIPWEFSVDLGSTQYLSNTQTVISLDASQDIPDPEATYQWYFNGILLADTSGIISVDQVGTYEVVITSGDLSCTVSDTVDVVYNDFSAQLIVTGACAEEFNSLEIDLTEGISPFITTLTNTSGSVNYAHSGNTIISDLSFGTYDVLITDSVGATFQNTINFDSPTGMDIYSQLEVICGGTSCLINDTDYPDAPLFIYDIENGEFTLDASIGVSNPNMNYEWFQDNISLGVNEPTITFEPNSDCYSGGDYIPLYSVEAIDPLTNCSETQSFYLRFFCPKAGGEAKSGQVNEGVSQLNLNTKVYPNPSEPHTNFTYQVDSTKQFEGVVEVFTVTGSLIYKEQVQGNSNYTLQMSLKTSGMYLIRLTTKEGKVKTDKIVIK